MRDIHCHILPGVDDGSRDLRESLQMLSEARSVGVTSIVATPHCRGSRFSMRHVVEAYDALRENSIDIPIALAYEVYYKKLGEVGLGSAERLCNQNTGEFLLELPTGQLPIDFERTLFGLQGLGLKVIIAHPERYAFVQQDLGIAEDWVERGCALQVSADFVAGSPLSKSKRTARKLISRGMVTYIASDAHCIEHYRTLATCLEKYGDQVRAKRG